MSDLIRLDDAIKAFLPTGGIHWVHLSKGEIVAILRTLPTVTVQAQIDAAVAAEREWWITSLAPIKHQVEFYTRRTDLFRKGDQP